MIISNHNTRRRRRLPLLIPGVLLLALLLVRGMSLTPRAFAKSTTAPQASVCLTGFDSPQFQSKQDAYVDQNGHVEELSVITGLGWTVNDLSARTGAPRVFVPQDLVGFDSPQFHAKQYAYIDPSNHIEELSLTAGGQWYLADLSYRTGAPPAYVGLTGFDSPQFQSKQYAYMDTKGHIEELSVTAGQQWSVADLTLRTGAPLASGSGLVGFDSPQFHSKQYAYIDRNGHIEELSVTAGGQWTVDDLSKRTGAPPAYEGLTGFDSPQFAVRQYAYIDTNYHIEHLGIMSIPGEQWFLIDLTARTGAPLAYPAYRGVIGYNSPQFSAEQYAYIDQNGDIEELSITSYVQWSVFDLTAHTGAPPALESCLTGFDSPQLSAKQYAYIDPNNLHVEELAIITGGQWYTTDLSALIWW